MHLKNVCLAALVMLFFASCTNQNTAVTSSDTAKIDGHPAWIMQGNIYEVNIRQYTQEGTFKAFEKNLDRLKDMGVQTLWFMPINPISIKDRKGALGSYYAVANYTAINPEYGTLQDWKDLVAKAHEMGFKVIIDWVPNHTGADHYWLEKHPDFYVLDSITKKPVSPFDWTDTRKLNYNNPAMCDSVIACMKYWITETNIDGFRCDVAPEVPEAFWKKCIATLKQQKNIFMLAEGDKPWLHKAGFDQTYTWNDFNMMKLIAKGERKAFALDSAIAKTDTSFPKNALRLFFTSNHDENSWNKADYATMPGESHAPFAVLTQTLPNSVPLIYSGQEEPKLDSISFFYKNPIQFGKYQRANFYKTLLTARKNNAALAANASFTKLSTSNGDAVYAFVRENSGKKVVVITNLSKSPQTITIKNAIIDGEATELFTNRKQSLKSGQAINLPAWGYLVYQY
ncbi:alpha-amylase family glycosyl hydrolase [Parasediminibacterium paludis]|uniref:Alpha-amylase family glycosyl hydrolase n=1 Tax=Parasediminibacterium paludis TaxID=908966 RepID=A0ABV8Q0C7_9BACT